MAITGGEAVVKSLAAHGVRTVFGIPGTHNLAIYDALLDSDIRHVLTRHEQGAAFMADGYARASGLPGVCITTTGPAVMNTLTALGTAYSDSSPILVIASQISAEHLGQGKGYGHESPDQLSGFRPVTKWSRCCETVADIPEAVREAFLQMKTGRPRPTVLEVPFDVLDGSGEVNIPEPAPTETPQPDESALDRAADLLKKAKRPLIWAGGGVIASGASSALRSLAEMLEAPVFPTTQGKGSLPEDHPLAGGNTLVHPLATEYLSSCDLMLAIGTRLSEMETARWSLRLPDDLIQIDVDAEQIGRNYPVTEGIVSDAKLALEALLDRCSDDEPRASRAAEVAELRSCLMKAFHKQSPEAVELMRTLRSALPRETVIVSDLTVVAYWCHHVLDVFEPRTYFNSMGFGALGFGLPAAIGAKLAVPDRPVVVLAGDGGFQFTCQELGTAVQFGVPVVVIVFNDDGYGILRPQQEGRYGLRPDQRRRPGKPGLCCTGPRIRCERPASRRDRRPWFSHQVRIGCRQPIVDRGSVVAAWSPHGRSNENVHGSARNGDGRLSNYLR